MKGKEIERRWLLKAPPSKEILATAKRPPLELRQGYLEVPGQLRVRITSNTWAELTEKIGKGEDRWEENADVSLEAAEMLLRTTPYKISKSRYEIDGWEVDFFHGNLKGLFLMEYEQNDPDNIVWPDLPAWAHDAVEVTNVLNNRQLAITSAVLDGDPIQLAVREIPRYVMTGGPCGGKSTILRTLTAEGVYHCVPEVATILMGQIGIMPEVGELTFQRTLYRVQRSFEEAAARQALKDGKLAVILDRGTLDSAAFVNGGVPAWCDIVSTTLETEYSNYDGVIMLDVIDRGSYELNKGSNAVRRETWEQAKDVESRIRKVWGRHPTFREVGGSLAEKEAFIREHFEVRAGSR